jgi:hypothetical protein
MIGAGMLPVSKATAGRTSAGVRPFTLMTNSNFETRNPKQIPMTERKSRFTEKIKSLVIAKTQDEQRMLYVHSTNNSKIANRITLNYC